MVMKFSLGDSDVVVDVTDRVEVHSNGKVWSCDCGQDIGTQIETRCVKCASCGKVNIDDEWETRESDMEGQTTIESFM